MSIEIKITSPELAAALDRLADAIGRTRALADSMSEPQADAGKAKPARSAAKGSDGGTPPTKSTSEAQPASGEAEKPSSKAAEDAASTPTESPPYVTYDDVRAAVLNLTKAKGRNAAVELLGRFEREDGEPATNGKELKEADWSEFVATASAEIEA